MMPKQADPICPNCGSDRMTETDYLQYRCTSCGARSAHIGGSSDLSILQWICPKCGYENPRGVMCCMGCGVNLTKPCFHCGATLRWHLRRCPACRAVFREGEKVLFHRRAEAILPSLSGGILTLTTHRLCFQPDSKKRYLEVFASEIVDLERNTPAATAEPDQIAIVLYGSSSPYVFQLEEIERLARAIEGLPRSGLNKGKEEA